MSKAVDDLVIEPMTPKDLDLVLGWASEEGWNPGIGDAQAFYAADPNGFLIGRLADEPVSAISVVRHSDTFGFLGLYISKPGFRGRGIGYATWQAGMAHMENRIVGLDGVPAQVDNYRASGFEFAHQSDRYSGHVEGRADLDLVPVTSELMPSLLVCDRQVSGADRQAYMAAWLQETPTRKTLVLRSGGHISAVGTIRACQIGHKIGPLFADDVEGAVRTLRGLVALVDAQQIMIDVPQPNEVAVNMVQALGLQQVFSCARMYRYGKVKRQLERIYGETTFELG
ncbi:MAG: GNAT family N-acetyltransferase [Pseudomonadota bacterium]